MVTYWDTIYIHIYILSPVYTKTKKEGVLHESELLNVHYCPKSKVLLALRPIHNVGKEISQLVTMRVKKL